mgnify:CR=1 FL=1
MSLKKRFFTLISAFFLIFSEASFAETAEPYKDDEFPLLLKDLRRAEIITFGTMPFAVLADASAGVLDLCHHLIRILCQDLQML